MADEQQEFREAGAINVLLSDLVTRELARVIFHEADEYFRVHYGSQRARLRILALGGSGGGLSEPLCFARGTARAFDEVRDTAVGFGVDALVKAGEEVDILLPEAPAVEHRI